MKTRILALIAPFFLTSHVAAQDVSKCLNLSKNSARLECFDKAHNTPNSIRFSQKNKQIGSLERNAQKTTSAKTVTPSITAEENFGKSTVQIQAEKTDTEKTLKTITSNIKLAEVTKAGKVRITLENGQVWQQASSDNTRVLSSRLKRQTSVVIKRALFSSYIMKTLPSGRPIKAKRIK